MNPLEPQRTAYFTQALQGKEGPVVVATDYIRNYVEQVRAYLPEGKHMVVLGTDGFGRSDTREALRAHFEVNRYQVVVAALSALAKEGKIKKEKVAEAIGKYGIDSQSAYPLHR